MSRFNFNTPGGSGGATGYSNGNTMNDPYSSQRDRSANPEAESLRSPPVRSARRGAQYTPYAVGGAGQTDEEYDPYREVPTATSTSYSNSNGSGAGNRNPYGDNPYAGSSGALNSRYDAGNSTDEPASLPRPTALERTRANRRSGGGGWNRSPTRRVQGNGDGSRQIEEVLRVIKQDWSFMTEEKCIPIKVALQFMDDSSIGLASKYDRFNDLHAQLQTALRQIVNEQHQGFNSSIGRFHAIQSALSTSQTRLRNLKDSLGSAKRSLETTRPELQGMAKTSQNYDDMLLLLSSIETLQSIPEKLEARISEKRFLSAVESLQDAMKEMRKDGMEDIGALRELRVYLSNQEHSLTDILIEELHNHLYLKSPYCENRWKKHANQHVRGISKDTATTLGGRQLYAFLDQLDTDSVMRDDPTKNPEADTFAYIHLLIESLNTLGRLDVAVETLAQRLPVELFRVVEKSTNEVDQRYPAGLRSGKDSNNLTDFSSLNSPQSVILNDLFGTLFARFEAIAEGHRVVHEIISGITKREGTRGISSLTSGFRELWKLYQSEIRSLLHDYLATSDAAYKRSNDGSRGSSVFSKSQRDRTKKMFKLKDMDSKSTDLITEKESLQSILTTSVPGLVSDSKTTDGAEESNSNNTANNTGTDGSATGHKLLVEPTVFNMAILLPPSLTFLNRLKEVVPSSSDIAMSTLTSFLDDFLINVFLPQLDETLVEMSAQTFIEVDAFTQDPLWQFNAKKPIFKGTAKFYKLIEAFCRMLDILPHDQAFTQLIITQIVAYYDKCCGWFKAIVSRTQPHPQSGKRLKISASLLEDDALKAMVDQLLNADDAARIDLINKENTHLLSDLQNTTVEEADLILDRRALAALCLLSTSMKWLASKLTALRFISAHANDPSTNRHSERFDKARRWTLIATQPTPEPDHVYLPLSDDSAAAFDGVTSSYNQLATDVLRLLHVDARAHVVHHLQKSLARTFALDQDLHEPDPEIVSLNAALAGIDEELSTHVAPAAQKFITTGLASLLDALVVAAAQNIQVMNAAGCARMQLNVLVLQQNLKNIEDGAQLRRAAVYFDLFSAGPDAVIAEAKAKGKEAGFTYEEMQTLLKLCYSENLRSERREVVVAAERGLEDRQLQLSEFLW
ncbi:hypothetical protein BT63DRAFT_401416 [Microthyrium microscopicum]|uniref:Exocyst complex component Sec8 n=1 Tax=Microthyrium microscopicum TaxID=703497 RepID=A0A6A6UD07_9PEZI|nr:hypothetical protein BT63DRAFT_401416 [Microthyrium microscopicum]